MYFLLKTGIFHCYVSLPEGNSPLNRRRREQILLGKRWALDSPQLSARQGLAKKLFEADRYRCPSGCMERLVLGCPAGS